MLLRKVVGFLHSLHNTMMIIIRHIVADICECVDISRTETR